MQPGSYPRPVSGEIVTEGAGRGIARDSRPVREAGADIVEAEFETLERPQDCACDGQAGAGPSGGEPPAGLSVLGQQGRAPGHFSRRGGPLFWSAGLGLAALSFWISGGHALLPLDGMAGGKDGESLRISAVQSRVEAMGGRPILHVEGGLTNEGDEALRVPPIGIDVTASDGATTRYLLGTNGGIVRPGERFVFSSRLVAPKSGVASVSLSLTE